MPVGVHFGRIIRAAAATDPRGETGSSNCLGVVASCIKWRQGKQGMHMQGCLSSHVVLQTPSSSAAHVHNVNTQIAKFNDSTVVTPS